MAARATHHPWSEIRRNRNTPRHRIRRFFKRLRNWPSERYHDVRFFFQRGKRGWSDGDSWNLDLYLAKVLARVLAYHATHSYTFPGENSPFPEGLTPEAWQAALLNLAHAFETYTQLLERREEGWPTDEELVALQTTMRKLFDYYFYLWA